MVISPKFSFKLELAMAGKELRAGTVKSSHGTERNCDKHMLTRSYVTSE